MITFRRMRWLDKWFGGLAVSLLRIVWLPIDYGRALAAPPPVRTILVQKYFGIGSIINAIPTIEALRNRYPNARIVLITFPEQVPLLQIINLVDEVLVIDDANMWRFAVTAGRVLLRLWQVRVDINVDLEFFSKFSMIMACLSLARVRVGFCSSFSGRTALLTHPVPFNHYRHISRCFLALAEALGEEVGERQPPMVVLPSLLDSHLAEILGACKGIDPATAIVVNVNTSGLCPLRSWPPERFAGLMGELLAADCRAVCICTGSQGERAQVQAVMDLVDSGYRERVVNAAGRTSFGGLMAMLERAALVVTNDSGPAHIAAAYGTPTVVLFGPETPVLYRPLNRHAVVLYEGGYCSPCINVLDNKQFDDCPNQECMRRIPIEAVFEACRKLLAKSDIRAAAREGV